MIYSVQYSSPLTPLLHCKSMGFLQNHRKFLIPVVTSSQAFDSSSATVEIRLVLFHFGFRISDFGIKSTLRTLHSAFGTRSLARYSQRFFKTTAPFSSPG